MRIARAIGIMLVLLLAGCGTYTPRYGSPVEAAAPAAGTPTPPVLQDNSGSDPVRVLRPGFVQDVNIATHPVTGWPAVAATAKYDQTDQPSMVVARVYHPTLHRWSAALQLDTGAATSGTDRFASSAIAITGDNTVHVVWGSSDADAGLWYAASADFGTSWSAPLRIGADCWFVNDLKATPDGQLVVLAACYRSRSDSETQPGLIVRRASGQWQPLERIGVPGWFGALESRAMGMMRW